MHSTQMRQLAKEYGRYWLFHSAPTTVALPGNRFAKNLAGFIDHSEEPQFRELLREYADAGCPRPGGYADVFHTQFKSPRVAWSVNAQLAPAFAGGWQSALRPGSHIGTHYKYDMCSAYLWAATLGLPETKTYRRSLQPWKVPDGVFRIRLMEPAHNAPFPFNHARECIATPTEIETYGLRVGEVIDGVTWSRQLSGIDILDAIQKVSTWKQAGRSYWGRWAQMHKITCYCRGKTWQLPNLALNVPWAHLIISRVKMRLWESSNKAVHVFVDSVITPQRLVTGHGLGDWKLQKTYKNGVLIKGTGQYGDIDAAYLERYAGISRGSLHRSTKAALARL